MKLTRREAMVLPAGLAAASVLPGAIRAEEPQVDGDGLYTQPWFHSSFLDLREDVAVRAGILLPQYGKRLSFSLRFCHVLP